jgi:hypothetical protein
VRIASCAPSQSGQTSRASTAGIRLWIAPHDSFGCGRDDREALYDVASQAVSQRSYR